MKKFILSQVIIWMFSSTLAGQIDYKTIGDFRAYLKDIKSIAAEFTQVGSEDGEEVRGKLLISKPYKFRINYYPPFPLVIVGNKNYISVYDYEMEQLSRMKSKENIFNFLLIDDIDLTTYFKFEEAINQNGRIKVTLYHLNSGSYSTIIFNENTKQIEYLEISEDEIITRLTFNNIQKVHSFDKDLFILKDPQTFGTPIRLTKTEIEKKYIP